MIEVNPWDPSNPQNRDRTRESQRQVRALLMEWDPIGVADAVEAADEYNCMISPIMHQLFEGAPDSVLASWIAAERTQHFGLSPDLERDAELARRLTSWWSGRTANHSP
jgi:hypothetical protein